LILYLINEHGRQTFYCSSKGVGPFKEDPNACSTRGNNYQIFEMACWKAIKTNATNIPFKKRNEKIEQWMGTIPYQLSGGK